MVAGVHGRALVLLILALPTITLRCRPIPDEVATTTIGFAPLAWLLAWFVARSMFTRTLDELDVLDGRSERGPPAWFGPVVSVAPLVVLASLAFASSDFEEGALLAVAFTLCPATIGYTIVCGRVLAERQLRRPADLAAGIGIALVLVPALVTWILDGSAEEAAADALIAIVLGGMFGVLPVAVLAGAVTRSERKAELERALDEPVEGSES